MSGSITSASAADQSRAQFVHRFPWFRYLMATATAMFLIGTVAAKGMLRFDEQEAENLRVCDARNQEFVEQNGRLASRITEAEGKLQATNERAISCEAADERRHQAMLAAQKHCFGIGDSEEKVITALGAPQSAYWEDTEQVVSKKIDRIRTFEYPNGGRIYFGKRGAYSYQNMGHLVCKERAE